MDVKLTSTRCGSYNINLCIVSVLFLPPSLTETRVIGCVRTVILLSSILDWLWISPVRTKSKEEAINLKCMSPANSNSGCGFCTAIGNHMLLLTKKNAGTWDGCY